MPKQQSPIRTIRRRKEWPAWAKWSAVNKRGEHILCDRKMTPALGLGFWLRGRQWWCERMHQAGHTRCYVTNAWTRTQRRIAGKVRG